MRANISFLLSLLSSLNPPLSIRRQRLHIPDPLRILLNTAITTKEPHPTDALDRLPRPLLLIFICLIDQILRLHIAIEIIANKIIVAVVSDAIAQSRETVRIAEGVRFDGVEDFSKVRVEGEAAVCVGVAQVLDVFGEVAEEEDIGFTDFTSYFDLDFALA